MMNYALRVTRARRHQGRSFLVNVLSDALPRIGEHCRVVDPQFAGNDTDDAQLVSATVTMIEYLQRTDRLPSDPIVTDVVVYCREHPSE